MTEMIPFFLLMAFVWGGVLIRHWPFNVVAILSKNKRRYRKSIKADIGFTMFFGFFTFVITLFVQIDWLPANITIGFLLLLCCISLVVIGVGLQEERNLNK